MLEDILKATNDGRELLSYGKSEKISSAKRIMLMRKITSHFIEKNLEMTLKICENLAEQIPKYFIGETKVSLKL